ncbi:Uncharacterised protein [Mycobacteroides abscessus subsp. abscessus]|nr:Uncharacterised protein [Mycobacteroides abscessus subsp. abscessus]
MVKGLEDCSEMIAQLLMFHGTRNLSHGPFSILDNKDSNMDMGMDKDRHKGMEQVLDKELVLLPRQVLIL